MECTLVNMANVRLRELRVAMRNESKSDAPIAKLVERTDLRGDRLAEACGWKARNGPQPYLEGKALTLDIAAKFARGLVGNGAPPICPEEILDLVEDKSILEYFWDVGAPQPKTPRDETIRLALEAGLQSLTKPQATEADLPLLAHVVSEVLIHVARNPASENSESFPAEVVAIAGVAVRNYKQPPEKAA
jgi:hypothetical protein